MLKHISSIVCLGIFLICFSVMATDGVKDVGTYVSPYIYDTSISLFSVIINVSMFFLGVGFIVDFRPLSIRLRKIGILSLWIFFLYTIITFAVTYYLGGTVRPAYYVDVEFVINALLLLVIPFVWGVVTVLLVGGRNEYNF